MQAWPDWLEIHAIAWQRGDGERCDGAGCGRAGVWQGGRVATGVREELNAGPAVIHRSVGRAISVKRRGQAWAMAAVASVYVEAREWVATAPRPSRSGLRAKGHRATVGVRWNAGFMAGVRRYGAGCDGGWGATGLELEG